MGVIDPDLEGAIRGIVAEMIAAAQVNGDPSRGGRAKQGLLKWFDLIDFTGTEDEQVKCVEAWQEYSRECEEMGVPRLLRRDFERALINKGCRQVRRAGGRVWLGLSL